MRVVSSCKGSRPRRAVAGFTLTEMLVTTLILGLVSTLMATGIPVAIDTYHKTVNSSNAQSALSTTVAVLRKELGSATDVRVPGDSEVVYYRSSEGLWTSIGNAEGDARGLVKKYYAGIPTSPDKDSIDGLAPVKDGEKVVTIPLVSDQLITDVLHVSYESVDLSDHAVEFTGLCVKLSDGHSLAGDETDTYKVLLRYVD
ncbi:MAG: prepilin-type N-terminal cleavage/methylation domain-containing protein [Atopobiaceae bacterium]|nr:prepilin-type N-terminal cleavage/methylation domain-containing protein [Atopobiaceae bacterium]